MRLFGRDAELHELASRIRCRRSFLVYGPAGVGKTRLLDKVAREIPSMLHISSCNTPQALFQELASRSGRKVITSSQAGLFEDRMKLGPTKSDCLKTHLEQSCHETAGRAYFAGAL